MKRKGIRDALSGLAASATECLVCSAALLPRRRIPVCTNHFCRILDVNFRFSMSMIMIYQSCLWI